VSLFLGYIDAFLSEWTQKYKELIVKAMSCTRIIAQCEELKGRQLES
jgi:hypothetical protein